MTAIFNALLFQGDAELNLLANVLSADDKEVGKMEWWGITPPSDAFRA